MRGVRSLRLVLGCVLAASVLAACGGSGGGSDASSGGGNTIPTLPSGGSKGSSTIPGGSTSGGKEGGRVRVLNAFAPGGKAGPALDIYDTFTPGEDDKPLIADLAYGELSDYVTPKGFSSPNLTMFPAGSKTRSDDMTKGAGQNLSNAGFDKGTQRTLVIGTTDGFDDPTKQQPIFSEILEVGAGDLTVEKTWSAIDGKGLLLANVTGAGIGGKGFDYNLAVDQTCPKRRDPENGAGGTVESLANGNAVPFEVAPGSHDLQVLVSPDSDLATTCDLSRSATTGTVDVPASGRVEVFVVDPAGDGKAMKLVVGKVAE